MNVRGKGGVLSLEKLLVPAGSMSRARRLICVSQGEKNCQKRGTRSCARSAGLRTSSSTIGCVSDRSGPQRLRNFVPVAETCSRSRHPVGVWAFALRLPWRCQLPVGSPAFLHNNRSHNPGLCRLGRLDRNPRQLEGSPGGRKN